MNMLSVPDATRFSWPAVEARGASVVLGEGRARLISHVMASNEAVNLALLFAQLYSGLDYLQRYYNTSEELPDYLALGDIEPGIPIRLKITSVSESPFYFVDED